jgi:hypothetical protein
MIIVIPLREIWDLGLNCCFGVGNGGIGVIKDFD